ncbi:hypothetical protein IQ243_16715 [Nostocales cyanobacterium LEGE 11386]|nr:hypothetical protein [Nostocales cyanobacterium LEGE 11386]
MSSNHRTHIGHFLTTIGTKPVNPTTTDVLQQFSMTARAITHVYLISSLLSFKFIPSSY